MPWKETDVMKERVKFVAAFLNSEDQRTMKQLCETYGISRKTGYKMLHRFVENGLNGLKDRSRAPLTHPNKTSDDMVTLIVDAKLKYGWGARKLRKILQSAHPEIPLESWPAQSTVNGILERNGLVKKRKRRKTMAPSSQPLSHATRPNRLWCSDHKGWFKTRDGRRCEPLTITDAYSRFILSIDCLPNTRTEHAWPVFERAFRRYGLPSAIRTDNGPPFASMALGGLSRLSIWWIKLGIIHERIEPGKPEQNGRHERMHKTMKDEVPVKETMAAQQKAYNQFIHRFNTVRPHEALADETPASVYTSSVRPYPKSLPPIEYPERFETRRVRHNGEIKWKGNLLYVSEALIGEPIGLERISEHELLVRYSFCPLGVLDERKNKIMRDYKKNMEKVNDA